MHVYTFQQWRLLDVPVLGGTQTDRQTDKDIYLHKETHISYTDIVWNIHRQIDK